MQDKTNNLQFTLQVLGDKTRYSIIKILIDHQDLCVTQIADSLNISVSAASQHFKVLEKAGLVKELRRGQKKCYLVSDDTLISKSIFRLIKRSDLN